MKREISIVVPIYNEARGLEIFLDRTISVMKCTGCSFEIVAVDDGSDDSSAQIIRTYAERYPSVVIGIFLEKNCGQHIAITAGLFQSCGEKVITIDADLQNPPEEIPRMLAVAAEGHDVVGTYRQKRQDDFFRKLASCLVNMVFSLIFAGYRIRDLGCMLRLYSRKIVVSICSRCGKPEFIPIAAMAYSESYTEIPVCHEPRKNGKSKYRLNSLIRLFCSLIRESIRNRHPLNYSHQESTAYFKIKERYEIEDLK